MEDAVVNSLKRGAVELGIDLIDMRTTEEERELIEYCKLPNTLQTKGKLRRTIRDMQRPPVYLVSARVKNALNSHGARGNTYKILEKFGGCYSEAESRQVVYDGADLMVKAYFWDRRGAMEFQTAMNNWEIHKALASQPGWDRNQP